MVLTVSLMGSHFLASADLKLLGSCEPASTFKKLRLQQTWWSFLKMKKVKPGELS